MNVAFSRWLPRLALALAAFCALRLIHESFMAQFHRLVLEHRYGLTFPSPSCTTGYCDYTMFWLAGIIAGHGHAALLYNPRTYTQAAAAILPYPTGYWPFVYPPIILLPARVIALFPLVPGFYATTVASLAFCAFLLRRAHFPWWCLAIGLLSPAALWNLYLGQISLLCGVILVCGLLSLAEKPTRSGAQLSLLIIKPPYALLLPVAVLAGRHWRAALSAFACVTVILLISVAISGPHLWLTYLGPGRAATRTLLEQPFAPAAIYEFGGTSIFWMARSFGAALPIAYTAQTLSALAAAITCWRLWRNPMDPTRRATLTILLTAFVSPYGFTYDLSALSLLLPTLARRATPWRNAALAAIWLAPAYIQTWSTNYGVLVTPIILGFALILVSQESSSFFEKKEPKKLLPL